LLAGLLAAFMSTFAGTLNAAQAYVTNDLYLKYVNKNASNDQVKWTNYIVGILVVVISIILGFFAKSVNQVLQILVSALWGSYMVSNILKWYWWRFNAAGYFWGMFIGIVAGFVPFIFPNLLPAIFPGFAPDIRILYYFPVILIVSTIGCLIATYSKPPTDDETLTSFYKSVRPWGFWKPIHKKVVAQDPEFEKNKDFWRDMFNIVMGIIGQTALVVLPIYIVVKKGGPMLITLAITIVVFVIMKKTWWDKLRN
ncbi:MAG: sodium:solute symporter family transporter, partial [Bacteroidota bacterium]